MISIRVVHGRALRRVTAVAAAASVGVGAGFSVPAHADAAAAGSATAIGLHGTGLLPVPPTPTITATQPPDSAELRSALIDLALPPLVVTASLTVVAQATQESRIPVPLFPALADNARRRHVDEAATNARSFARAQGVSLALDGSGGLLAGLLSGELLSVSAVESVAIARCVDGVALFDTAFSVAGLTVLGQEAPLDAILLPLLSALDLPGVISVKQGEAGPLPDGGIFINGLHVVVPALGVDLVVARSEARMPQQCAAEAPAAPIEVAEASASSADESVAFQGELAELAEGGGPVWTLPLGFIMLVLGGAAGRTCRRAAPVPARTRGHPSASSFLAAAARACGGRRPRDRRSPARPFGAGRP